jgi:DNA-binding HxlR family transcriptional regulator
MSPDRIYRHFCMGARALELIGGWTLLTIRDLLLGPQRFTDLERGLNEITPTRLTARLRLLESAGLVARDPAPSGRDVWYSLTDAGRDLEPVIEALIQWGTEHCLERPVAGEAVPPQPTMIGTKVWLNRNARSCATDSRGCGDSPRRVSTRCASVMAPGRRHEAASPLPTLPYTAPARRGLDF